ncbi:MAG: 30S ribosomal protein S6 [Candidatus Binatia bacterium]
MTLYETVYIVRPDQGEKVKEFTDGFKKIIEDSGGTVSSVNDWGLKDLAYEIRKQTKGYYTLLQYQATARAVAEIERNMKLSEGVLRYLTVRVDESAMQQPEKEDLPEEAIKPPEENLEKPASQS